MSRTKTLHLRMTPAAKQRLRLTAKISRESLSDFLLQSALARADEILSDSGLIKLNDVQWQAFVATLDAPPKPRPG